VEITVSAKKDTCGQYVYNFIIKQCSNITTFWFTTFEKHE